MTSGSVPGDADLPDRRDRVPHGRVRRAVRGVAAGAGGGAAGAPGSAVAGLRLLRHLLRARAVHGGGRLPAAAVRVLPLEWGFLGMILQLKEIVLSGMRCINGYPEKTTLLITFIHLGTRGLSLNCITQRPSHFLYTAPLLCNRNR